MSDRWFWIIEAICSIPVLVVAALLIDELIHG